MHIYFIQNKIVQLMFIPLQIKSCSQVCQDMGFLWLTTLFTDFVALMKVLQWKDIIRNF